MAKTVITTYDVGDKVWWQTRGKAYCGRITSAQIVIDKFGTKVDYIVLVDDKFVGYEFYETISEKDIYKKETYVKQEVEKE